MRKLLYLVVTAGVMATTLVALASAAGNGASRASAEAANAYLPAGVKPAINDWSLPGGDSASTLFSQLKEINSTNVGSLKVVWNGSLQPPAARRPAAAGADLLPERPDVPELRPRHVRGQPG